MSATTPPAESTRYFGGFADYADMVDQFIQGEYDYDKGEHKKVDLPEGFPTDEQVLFAAYGLEESYSGDATVVYETPAGLFIAGGSHCSCNGLEGQWAPTATTRAALGLMWKGEQYDSAYARDARDAFNAMFPAVTP